MPNVVRFQSFEVDLDAGELLKRGIRIKLRDQSLQVLAALLETPGQVVSRADLQKRIWRDEVFVDFDNNLNILVARLRNALGDSAEHPRFIQTVPKHGYRFVGSLRAPAQTQQRLGARARLLVLPFVNMSGESSQDDICDALTDEIITQLARLSPERLAVIARTTSMHYKESRDPADKIGRDLKVQYIVEGALRSIAGRLSFTVQLISTTEQVHVFAAEFESAEEVVAAPGNVVHSIARHLPGLGQLANTQAAVVHGNLALSHDPAAYRDYLAGRSLLAKARPAEFKAAKLLLERALAAEPQFALAYDALAKLCWYLGYFGVISSREAFAAGIVYAVRALELDNSSAETHALLGQFHKTVQYNWPEVHREMEIARRLDRNSPLVCMRYAVSELMPHGRLQEAIVELERALDLDPMSLFPRMWLAIVLLLARQPQRALSESERLMEVEPEYFMSYFVRASALRCLDRMQEALEAQKTAVALSGNAAAMLAWLGLILPSCGCRREARGVLAQLRKMNAGAYVPPSSFAWVHLGLGEIDCAFRWMNRAVNECDQFMMPIKSYAFFDPLRHDPRFALLLQKMHLDE